MIKKPRLKPETAATEFEHQMAVARRIMHNDRVALRALALGDQYPELDVDTRVRMAREQAGSRKA